MGSIPAAIGFRVHSGWAALVAVAGSPASPAVIDRRRIRIADPSVRGSVQPYHKAEELGVSKAREFLDQCAKASQAMAKTALRGAIRELRQHDVEVCAVLVGSGRPGGTLESILASHAAIHSAEGDFFRHSLASAAAACKLPVRKVKEKELLDLARAKFHMDVNQHVSQLRKTLGSPWTQDEKLAAIAGWLALAGG